MKYVLLSEDPIIITSVGVRNTFQKRHLPLHFDKSASMQNISLSHGEIQKGKTVEYIAWRHGRYTEI